MARLLLEHACDPNLQVEDRDGRSVGRTDGRTDGRRCHIPSSPSSRPTFSLICQDRDRPTAPPIAASMGHVESIGVLLAGRADPMALDSHSSTAVHYAALEAREAAVVLLLQDPRALPALRHHNKDLLLPLQQAASTVCERPLELLYPWRRDLVVLLVLMRPTPSTPSIVWLAG